MSLLPANAVPLVAVDATEGLARRVVDVRGTIVVDEAIKEVYSTSVTVPTLPSAISLLAMVSFVGLKPADGDVTAVAVGHGEGAPSNKRTILLSGHVGERLLPLD